MDAGLAKGSPADRGHVHEIATLWSAKLLGPGQWARVGVVGEGSCFFHSICYVTNRDNYVNKNTKEQMEIAAGFRCHTFKDKFTPSVYEEFKSTVPSNDKSYETLMNDFCTPSVWADEVMIKFAARLLGINILFLDLTSETMYCNVHSKETLAKVEQDEPINQPTMVVAWVSRSHFEPIVKIINAKEGRLRTMFNPAISRADYDTVKYIMTRLSSDCALNSKAAKPKSTAA